MDTDVDAASASGPSALARFIDTEMRAYPGRWNVALRTLLSCAICIVGSMTFGVPFVYMSLFTVFFATQANVVMAKIVGYMMVGGMLAVVVLLLVFFKFTYGYPALRLAVLVPMLVLGLYLMRATKLGPLFYMACLMVSALQGYFDLVPSGELLLRVMLWSAVAGIYPILVCILVNTLLLPAEPVRQLKDGAHREFRQLDAILAHAEGVGPAVPFLKLEDIQRGVLSSHKLLRFAWMRDAQFRRRQAWHLALTAAGSRLREQALRLQHEGDGEASPASIASVRTACRRLDDCIESGAAFSLDGIHPLPQAGSQSPTGVMWHALNALADRTHEPAPTQNGGKPAPKGSLFVPDAFTNPVYIQFALKTALAMMLGYLFYVATDWSGISTVVVTCLIVAQPSLGASHRKIKLRVLGAVLGAAIAACMMIWVIPHLDSIVGLLVMTLPVLGLAAYISAGSERIAYMGQQLMYTFALAVLGGFGPTTDLTTIRDRLVGIGIGIGLSYVIQTRLWPETESKPLAQRFAALLKSLASYIAIPADPQAKLARPAQSAQVWQAYDSCTQTLERFAIEPSWQQGEGEHEQIGQRAQQLTADVREVLLAAGAFGTAIDICVDRLPMPVRDFFAGEQRQIANRLDAYADGLVASGDVLYLPQATPKDTAGPPTRAEATDEAGSVRKRLDHLARCVDYLVTPAPTGQAAPAKLATAT